MSGIPALRLLKSRTNPAIALGVMPPAVLSLGLVSLAVFSLAFLGGMVLAAQDKYSLKVPNGLAVSDFRGYEDWQDVAVSQTENGIKAIVANPAMIDAYRNGVPGNGKHLPDGVKVAKIEWTSKKNT